MPLYGIDISKYQAGIDLSVVPCDFVIIYVSGGPRITNPYWEDQVKAALRNGKRVLLYHYAHDGRAKGTAAQEAARFLALTKPYWALVDGLVLDWESEWQDDIPWALEWLVTVRRESGKQTWFYAYYHTLKDYDCSPIYRADFPLWEAAYVLDRTVNGQTVPTRIDGYKVPDESLRWPVPEWGAPAMWQFTSTGFLTGWGDRLDLNVFRGDRAAWDKIHSAKGQTVRLTSDQFMDKYMGKPVYIPGYSTAECVALFWAYNREVNQGEAYSAAGAWNLWEQPIGTPYIWDTYERVQIGKRYDWGIWSGAHGAYPNGGAGHVAQLITDNGDGTGMFFSQNPNAPAIIRLSYNGLVGFLRPIGVTHTALTPAGGDVTPITPEEDMLSDDALKAIRAVVQEELANIAREGLEGDHHAGPLFGLDQNVKALVNGQESLASRLNGISEQIGGTATAISGLAKQLEKALSTAPVPAEIDVADLAKKTAKAFFDLITDKEA